MCKLQQKFSGQPYISSTEGHSHHTEVSDSRWTFKPGQSVISSQNVLIPGQRMVEELLRSAMAAVNPNIFFYNILPVKVYQSSISPVISFIFPSSKASLSIVSSSTFPSHSPFRTPIASYPSSTSSSSSNPSAAVRNTNRNADDPPTADELFVSNRPKVTQKGKSGSRLDYILSHVVSIRDSICEPWALSWSRVFRSPGLEPVMAARQALLIGGWWRQSFYTYGSIRSSSWTQNWSHAHNLMVLSGPNQDKIDLGLNWIFLFSNDLDQTCRTLACWANLGNNVLNLASKANRNSLGAAGPLLLCSTCSTKTTNPRMICWVRTGSSRKDEFIGLLSLFEIYF